MKQIAAALIILTIFIFASCGQQQSESETIGRIDDYLSKLEAVGFHGAVLVGRTGEILVSKGYGFSNDENQIKNSPSTIFDIGSITKQFTATAILKLETQGKLSTGDSISKYFAGVPNDKRNITIHDLLRHQSGLISNVGRDYERITKEEFLAKVFSSPLRFDIGTDFSYSNIGYSLLAMIVEKVSGQSYEQYLYENLWKPSQMETTGYSRPRFDTNLVAVGYDREENLWGKPTDKEWDTDAPYWHLKGNGGILSTTEDMYRWHKTLLTEKILSKESKHKLFHPPIRPEENKDFIYAYGWDVSRTDRNTTRFRHNGSNNIFYADFYGFIEEDIALIMLTNRAHPVFGGINQEISSIMFNKDHVPEIPIANNEANRRFTKRILSTIERSGLEKAKEEFQKRNPDEQLVEFTMRNEGFNSLDNQKPDIAMQIFEMNVFAYPKSAKALQGLAEGYMETGKNEPALKYFKQSLAVNPENQFVKDMIKKLGE
jgi:CubicO group peptidase (beta-lactamase class C family)